jgi:hypothetical protein
MIFLKSLRKAHRAGTMAGTVRSESFYEGEGTCQHVITNRQIYPIEPTISMCHFANIECSTCIVSSNELKCYCGNGTDTLMAAWIPDAAMRYDMTDAH